MQTVSSMQTSVNTRKLPAIWKKLNLAYLGKLKYPRPITVVDYGSGRLATSKQVLLFLMNNNTSGIVYRPYDPYWGEPYENQNTLSCLIQWKTADLCICANVLNVIDDLSSMSSVIKQVTQAKFWAFQIYEGDKSQQGQYTKNHTCYQRNEPTQNYQALIETIIGGTAYREGNIITNCLAILK